MFRAFPKHLTKAEVRTSLDAFTTDGPWNYIFSINRLPRNGTECLCSHLQVLGLQYQVAVKIRAGQPVDLLGNPFA